MDSIKIVITRGCKPDGTGGTVVDDAIGILDTMPDGVPLLDVVCAAFADAYGIHQIAAPTAEDPDATIPVSLYRNISMRFRKFAEEIVASYASKTAAQTAAEQAAIRVAVAMSKMTVIEKE